MEIKNAVVRLSALAQESRLRLYRMLVEAGPEGLAATDIANGLDIPTNTLSFHVKALKQAGLVEARHEGRFIYYSANFEHMNALVSYLTENCCGGRICEPGARVPRRRAS
jgi:ArsR family transcriptional regulator, arsenate/arsenite/antimonite-responsive transcriptional repressor